MTIRWYIAKYVDDLGRNEPINIGVIVSIDGQARVRFLGERDGAVDGRLVRWAASADNYRSWLNYWRHAVTEERWETAIAARRVSDNYYVEHAGERLVGTVANPDVFVEDLFARLVSDDKGYGSEMQSVAKRAESLFTLLKISDRVQSGCVIDLPDHDHLRYDYRFDNGSSHLMKAVAMGPQKESSWERAHAAAWTFQHTPRRLDNRETKRIALLSGENDATPKMIDIIEKQEAVVVRLDDEDDALASLRDILYARH